MWHDHLALTKSSYFRKMSIRPAPTREQSLKCLWCSTELWAYLYLHILFPICLYYIACGFTYLCANSTTPQVMAYKICLLSYVEPIYNHYLLCYVLLSFQTLWKLCLNTTFIFLFLLGTWPTDDSNGLFPCPVGCPMGLLVHLHLPPMIKVCHVWFKSICILWYRVVLVYKFANTSYCFRIWCLPWELSWLGF